MFLRDYSSSWFEMRSRIKRWFWWCMQLYDIAERNPFVSIMQEVMMHPPWTVGFCGRWSLTSSAGLICSEVLRQLSWFKTTEIPPDMWKCECNVNCALCHIFKHELYTFHLYTCRWQYCTAAVRLRCTHVRLKATDRISVSWYLTSFCRDCGGFININMKIWSQGVCGFRHNQLKTYYNCHLTNNNRVLP